MLVSYETTKKHDYVTTVTYTYTDYSLTVARCVQLNLLLSFSSHHSAHRQSQVSNVCATGNEDNTERSDNARKGLETDNKQGMKINFNS